MAPQDFEQIHLFQIGRGSDVHIARYSKASLITGDRKRYDEIAKGILDDGKLPPMTETVNGTHDPNGSDIPTLDIELGAQTGLHAFFFEVEIDSKTGRPLLEFSKEDPIISLPIEHGNAGMFTDKVSYERGERRWASFVFDVGAARASTLAKRIKSNPKLGTKMRLPFAFNVIDPVLGFAPWVLPDHNEPNADHEHGNQDRDHQQLAEGKRSINLVTHGGIHPRLSTFVTIDI